MLARSRASRAAAIACCRSNRRARASFRLVVFSMHPMLNPTQDASADAQTPRAPGAARPSPPNPAQHHLHHILRLAVTQFSNLARCSVITAHHHISSPVPTHMPFTCTSPTCPAFAPHISCT